MSDSPFIVEDAFCVLQGAPLLQRDVDAVCNGWQCLVTDDRSCRGKERESDSNERGLAEHLGIALALKGMTSEPLRGGEKDGKRDWEDVAQHSWLYVAA